MESSWTETLYDSVSTTTPAVLYSDTRDAMGLLITHSEGGADRTYTYDRTGLVTLEALTDAGGYSEIAYSYVDGSGYWRGVLTNKTWSTGSPLTPAQTEAYALTQATR